MNLKSLGVMLGGLGAVAGFSFLRTRSGSLAEEEAPQTERGVPPETIERFERAYRKVLNDKSREAADFLYANIKRLKGVQNKIQECQSAIDGDLAEAIDEMSSTWGYLDTIRFESRYVDEMTDFLARHEPRDRSRMRAYALYAQQLYKEQAEDFARIAGEGSVGAIVSRWGNR